MRAKAFAKLVGAAVVAAVLSVGMFGCDGDDNNPGNGGHTHSYGAWEVETAATCEAAGREKRVCGCGESETRTIPQLTGAQCETIPYGEFTDSRDGQIYRTVTIGSQT
jgi:hypothetical protein